MGGLPPGPPDDGGPVRSSCGCASLRSALSAAAPRDRPRRLLATKRNAPRFSPLSLTNHRPEIRQSSGSRPSTDCPSAPTFRKRLLRRAEMRERAMAHIQLKTVIGIIAALAARQVAAAQLAVESEPLAKRTVTITEAAQLGDPAAVAVLDRELHAAAAAVCDEQYPRDMVYVAHACRSLSFADAMEKVRRMRSRQPHLAHSGSEAAIVVQAH